MTNNSEILADLAATIEGRKNNSTKNSYVASLFAKGRKKIAQKVGEEAVELVIAAAHNDREEAISESADLLFHMLVLWSDMDINAEDVYGELRSREGLSGIEEKKSRGAFLDGL